MRYIIGTICLCVCLVIQADDFNTNDSGLNDTDSKTSSNDNTDLNDTNANNFTTKVIQLQYKNVDDVIPLLKPVLSSGDKISGKGKTLVLHVRPETLTAVRQVLHSVDVQKAMLTIVVFQGDEQGLEAMTGNNEVYSTQPRDTRQRLQSVSVMDGESAFVTTGADVPVIQSVTSGWGNDTGPDTQNNNPNSGPLGWSNAGVSFTRHQIQNGFLLHADLQGNKVKLKIKRIQQRQSQVGQQQFEDQTIESTTLVPFNKWVKIGASESAAQPKNSISISTGDRFSMSSTLFVKILKNKQDDGNYE